MNSNGRISGTLIRLALVHDSRTSMFGPCSMWARSTAARGTGRFAPTGTPRPSSRSRAIAQASNSWVVTDSISELVEVEEPAGADLVQIGHVILRFVDPLL